MHSTIDTIVEYVFFGTLCLLMLFTYAIAMERVNRIEAKIDNLRDEIEALQNND